MKLDKYFKDICNPARQGYCPAVPFYENTHLIVFLTPPLMQRYTALWQLKNSVFSMLCGFEHWAFIMLFSMKKRTKIQL